jgi:hypothetical protein
MDDDFSCFMIVMCFSEYAFNIGAMHKLSQTKTADIFKFTRVLIETLMLDRS